MSIVRCPRCSRNLPSSAFYRNRSQPRGRSGWCGACQNAKTRAWRDANRDRIDARNAARRAPQLEKVCVACRRIFRTSRAATIRCELHRGGYRLPEQNRRANQLRRDREGRRARILIPLAGVYARDGGICWICERPVESARSFPDPLSPSLDHVTPLSRGGRHAWDNVRLAHLHCNSARGNRVAREVTA